MKTIKITGYTLTLFVVNQDDAIHITVNPNNGKIDLNHFKDDQPISEKIIDEFKQTFCRAPISRNDKVINNSYYSDLKLLIIILK